jgi:hypothetical protein
MKWFRKTCLWASVGCLGATTPAFAQTNWRPLANEPAEVRPVSIGVTLGKPTPIAPETLRVVNAFVPIGQAAPIRQATYSPSPRVARGAMPTQADEPKRLSLPNDLLPLAQPNVATPFQPVQGVQPPPKDKAKIIEIGPEKIKTPKMSTPPTDSEERIIILQDGGPCLVDEQGRSLFGLGFGGDRRLYGSAEMLLWTTRGMHLPPLVTTASPSDPEDTRGALGFGSTRILFGDGNALGGLRPGARFTLGYNLDPCGLCAIEGSFLFLSRKNDGATFDSNSTPVIGRPFFNINTGMQDRELTTSPGILPGDLFRGQGNLQINMSSTLFGAEVNNRWLLWSGCNFQATGILGFRCLDLSDHLSLTENVVSLRDIPGNAPNPPISRAGDQILVFDRFDTHNRFYGAQIGANAEWLRGPWSLDAGFKLAFGATQQSVDIDGGQRITSLDGRVQNFVGGLYALPSNIGHHSQTRFGFVPEVGFKLGYNFTDNIRLTVGCDFLCWNSVLRPGDQIDQSLNANIIPNSGAPFPPASQVRPIVPFRTTSYWAAGLNAGLEFRY